MRGFCLFIFINILYTVGIAIKIVIRYRLIDFFISFLLIPSKITSLQPIDNGSKRQTVIVNEWKKGKKTKNLSRFFTLNICRQEVILESIFLWVSIAPLG